MTEKETIRKAMSILGSRKSEAKTKAARLNAKLPRKRKGDDRGGNSHQRRKKRRMTLRNNGGEKQ